MAKKTRTPPPPRTRQQGPGRREPTRVPLALLTRRNALIGAGAVGAVVAIVLAVSLSRGGGSNAGTTVAPKMTAAGCTFKTFPSQGQSHVQSIGAKVKYNSFPPTSGPHYSTPLIWNRYSQSVPLVAEVHNLEHGGVIIQYGDKVPSATVEQLTAFYDSSPNGMLLAPLPKLSSKIALTAWAHLATCARFSERAFKAFRDAFRGKGPERFPVSSLKQGT